MPMEVNGGLNGAHVNDSTKLKFDTIEDTIKAFSMSPHCHSISFLFSQRVHAVFFRTLRLMNIISRLENGEFIVVLDSTDRENEGDLIIAAEAITTEQMAFMIRHAR